MALQSDTTPAIPLEVVGGSDTTIHCERCYNLQYLSCTYDSCPTETLDDIACRGGGGDCTAEETAFDDCFYAHGAELGPCFTERLARCFPE